MTESVLLTTVVGFLALLGATLYQLFRDSQVRARDIQDRNRDIVLRMGRLTPDRPRQSGGLFQCLYCKTFGPPGRCQSCGAPNGPAEHDLRIPERMPDTIHRLVSSGAMTPNEARSYILKCDAPISEQTAQELRDAWRRAHTGTRSAGVVALPPKFDLVKW